jgi:hypothetical protein
MPPYKKYASRKQEAWAHTASGLHALGVTEVKGKDAASKGKKLPRKAKRK